MFECSCRVTPAAVAELELLVAPALRSGNLKVP